MKQEEADAILEKIEKRFKNNYAGIAVYQTVEQILNSLVSEDEGCPLCQKPEVLVHWQNMLKEYERFMVETKTEISLRMWEEYMTYCRKAEKDEKVEHLGKDNFRITGTPVHFVTWLKERK